MSRGSECYQTVHPAAGSPSAMEDGVDRVLTSVIRAKGDLNPFNFIGYPPSCPLVGSSNISQYTSVTNIHLIASEVYSDNQYNLVVELLHLIRRL